jgi:hypothetical protein
MQEELKLKNARLATMLPAIFKVPEEIPKELLFLNRIISRWVHTDSHYQWFSLRCVLETMICSLGQVNGWVASLLHYSSVGGIGCCWLLPDSSALFDNKIFGLEKMQMLGWIEHGLVVWDVMGDEIAGVGWMEGL